MPVATQIKRGQTIIVNGELYKILTLTHITPGKGNAVVQTDLRNIRTGIKTEKRFRSAETVEVAFMETRDMQYLYEADGVYYFMNPKNYDQLEVSTELLGDDVKYLVPEMSITMDFFEDNPVGVALPASVTLKVVETDPVVKLNTQKSSSTKPATLESGLVTKVPMFICEGESIVVSTEDGRYLERASTQS